MDTNGSIHRATLITDSLHSRLQKGAPPRAAMLLVLRSWTHLLLKSLKPHSLSLSPSACDQSWSKCYTQQCSLTRCTTVLTHQLPHATALTLNSADNTCHSDYRTTRCHRLQHKPRPQTTSLTMESWEEKGHDYSWYSLSHDARACTVPLCSMP